MKKDKYIYIYFIVVGIIIAALNIIIAADRFRTSFYYNALSGMLGILGISKVYFYYAHIIFEAVIIFLITILMQSKAIAACCAVLSAGILCGVVVLDNDLTVLMAVFLAAIISVFANKRYTTPIVIFSILAADFALWPYFFFAFGASLPKARFSYMPWLFLAFYGFLMLIKRKPRPVSPKPSKSPVVVVSQKEATARLILSAGLFLFISYISYELLSELSGISYENIGYSYRYLRFAIIPGGLMTVIFLKTARYRSETDNNIFDIWRFSLIVTSVIILADSIYLFSAGNCYFLALLPSAAMVFICLEREIAKWFYVLATALPALILFISEFLTQSLYNKIGAVALVVPMRMILIFGIYITFGLLMLRESKKTKAAKVEI